jgi:putative Mg2+ transporter-C (MgtC) family protein
MDQVWQELSIELGDVAMLVRTMLRLLLACGLGSLIGLNRERAGENAGWRTHVLVTLAATTFVMAMKDSGGSLSDMSRIMQGVATGIGFLGGGVILRMADPLKVKGLTTAASIWLAAAIGVAIGAGRILLPAVATLTGWLALAFLRWLERLVWSGARDHDA